ncbi:glycosyltransferase family 2 protein [Mesorhizobium sp. CAU 1741]|uniref:glycosyltransferase family 2 protein n=1 Tax=Mesorhizobium sp. CAU 1741 TaxID=3140366 RepID=UPI00325B2B0B
MPFVAWHFGAGRQREGGRGAVGAPAARRPAPATSRVDGVRARAILDEWRPVLSRLRLEREAERPAQRTVVNGTHFVQELLASGVVGEARLFEAIAAELELMFIADIDPSRLTLEDGPCRSALRSQVGLPLALLEQPDAAPLFIVARVDIGLAALRLRLARQPDLKRRLLIAPPSALRGAILSRARERLLFDAQSRLFLRLPEFSARIVANAWQGVLFGVLVAVLCMALAFAPMQTLLVVQVVGMVAFLACVVLRFLALGAARPLRLQEPPAAIAGELPVYSVLVALYQEREVLPQLLVALGKLQWPRSKLEIKLVCEEDDEETLSVLRAHALSSCIEIVEVPMGEPRTKPKALAYALPLCSGEYVTLYDAEDMPHPQQLLEAWHRFRADGDDLACLQAPLVATNPATSALSRMFAFEYAGLFRGILPWLAKHDLVLPLGGTSNHFRRSALDAVGGWDPHNVTEDADLGLRLKRFGYRVGVIGLPTFEEAPEDFATWRPQRTRWFKGWLQTWLVHMRAPVRLWSELGTASFLAFQALFLGTIVSVLVHPLALGTIAYVLARFMASDVVHITQVVIATTGLFTIALGYGAFLAVGRATLSRAERREFWRIVALTPVHWLLLSWAAWWAIFELYRRPHQWNKTPHRKGRPSLLRGQRVDERQVSASEGSPMIFSSSSPMLSRLRPS